MFILVVYKLSPLNSLLGDKKVFQSNLLFYLTVYLNPHNILSYLILTRGNHGLGSAGLDRLKSCLVRVMEGEEVLERVCPLLRLDQKQYPKLTFLKQTLNCRYLKTAELQMAEFSRTFPG